MKKLILILALILAPTSAYCWGVVVSQEVAADDGSFTPDCTNDHFIVNYFEGTDNSDRYDPTTGTPAGCIVTSGDTTPSVSQAATTAGTPTPISGSYSLSAPTRQDYLTYDSSTYPLFNSDNGTVEVWAYFDSTLNANTYLVHFKGVNAQDNLYIRQTGSEAMIYYDTNDQSSVSATTSTAGMTTGNWYKIVGKWDINGVSNTLSIEVFNSSEELQDSATSSSSLNTWTTAENELWVGFTNYVEPHYGVFLDDLVVYRDWVE
jgi:hypothetical protein